MSDNHFEAPLLLSNATTLSSSRTTELFLPKLLLSDPLFLPPSSYSTLSANPILVDHNNVPRQEFYNQHTNTHNEMFAASMSISQFDSLVLQNNIRLANELIVRCQKRKELGLSLLPR